MLLLSKKRGTTVNHSEKWKKVKINIPITEEVLSKILNIPETSVYKILINLEKGGYLKRSGNSCTLLYYSRWNFLFRDDYQKALSI